MTKIGKSVLRYKLGDLYTACPECGSDKIDHSITGLNACKNCGNVWRAKYGKRERVLGFTTS